MLKLVFVDLDGTFCDSQKNIPERNLRALDLAAEKGVQFVPCTGRNINGLPVELSGAACVHYAICGNGASVMDVRTGEALHTIAIDRARIIALYQRVRDLPCTIDVFSGDKILLERSRAKYIDEACGDDLVHRDYFYRLRTMWDGTFEEMIDRGPVTKINFLTSSDEDKATVRAAVDEVGGLGWTYSLPMNTEVQVAGVNKGAAVQWLCAHLGIDVADVAAFGDGENDTEMIRVAGDGVAMGNACADVKAVADHECAGCDEGGVGLYLETVFASL